MNDENFKVIAMSESGSENPDGFMEIDGKFLPYIDVIIELGGISYPGRNVYDKSSGTEECSLTFDEEVYLKFQELDELRKSKI